MLYVFASRASIFPQELLGYKDIEGYKGLFRIAEPQVSMKVLIKSFGLIVNNCKRLSLREVSRFCFVFCKASNKRKYNPTSGYI